MRGCRPSCSPRPGTRRKPSRATWTPSTAARLQGALWLELRAARGFANFLAAQTAIDEARQTLPPVWQQLTEGHDTLDYVYADALLKTLE